MTEQKIRHLQCENAELWKMLQIIGGKYFAQHSPNAKLWVGLADEDIAELRRNGAHSVSDADFMAIEAKLKEKNCA